ncbi:MAG: sulfatase-like hydrolase/transferase [Candidatus Latescibacteria bacterium]|nr:sulfatase-like hydrolase/transferase [Candidatus Latescibacterota bacterium]
MENSSVADSSAEHASSEAVQRPNILLITTDQHSAEALGHLGCNDLMTPHMDRLADRGISFAKSYSANPVCCPARASWFTGRYTPENGVMSNGSKLVPSMPDLGQWLRQGGYNAYYSGKWHIPGRDVAQSFDYICDHPRNTAETGDIVSTRSAIGFLENYDEKEPFFLSVGLLNPHDICSFVLTHTMHEGQMPFPEIDDLPPLPPNFDIDMTEPEIIRARRNQYMTESGEESGMEKWEEKLYRYYIWSYYRYIEKVDGQIGLLLDALKNSAFKDNTVVILSSDHGDGHIRHKMVFKSFLYDEAARVPFIMSWPGHIEEQVIDREHLVSGVDLFPTVCDYAGITPPPTMRGYSLRPLAEGQNPEWRVFVVAHATGGGTMLRTDRYKLITYENDPVIQIFDMEADPWETRNLAESPDSGSLSRELQNTLADYESGFELAEL